MWPVTHRARWFVSVSVLLMAALAVAWLAPRLGLLDAPPELREEEPRLPSFDAATAWLNGGPLTSDSLRGRTTVIMVWSDTDPRSLRALPEVESWHRAYARFGVRVIGVLAPDYTFGTDIDVARATARRLGLTFPIALDPAYAIRAQLARAGERPSVVVADTLGRIVHHAGGSDLGGVDHAIRAQLRKVHPALFPVEPDPVPAMGEPSPEPRFVFLGASRVEEGPLANSVAGHAQTFTTQFRFQEEGKSYVPYPVGRWTPEAEGLRASRGGAANYVAVRYDGGHALAVLGPPSTRAVRVWVLGGDDWLPREALGDDVRLDARGASYLDVTEPRLYSIARGGAQVLRLSPDDMGFVIHAFVFEPSSPGS